MPYLVIPADSHLRALDRAEGLRRCACCDAPLNKRKASIDLTKRPKDSPPLSTTEDGFVIASPAFRARYDVEGWSGLDFRRLSNGYFHVEAKRRLRLCHEHRFLYARDTVTGLDDLDADQRILVKHSESCGHCGTYFNVIGQGAHVIARGEVPLEPLEFAMGDIETGQGESKDFPLIAGDGLRASHQREAIRGTSVFEPVTYEPWAQSRTSPRRRSADILPFPMGAAMKGVRTPANDWHV